MLQVNYKIDLWRDLDIVTKSLLDEFGIKYRNDKKTDDLLLDFLSVRRKMIPQQPREVLITPVLQEKLANHSKLEVVEHIQQLLMIGGNLNFFQSETLYQNRKHDHLVYEWGVHHFHLSIKKKKIAHSKNEQKIYFLFFLLKKRQFYWIFNLIRKMFLLIIIG